MIEGIGRKITDYFRIVFFDRKKIMNVIAASIGEFATKAWCAISAGWR